RRGVDLVLRTLDVVLSLLFLVVAAIPIALIILESLATSVRPLLYRGERVGRGGRFYTMLKFRTLGSGAEERLGPYLGEELVPHTRGEQTPVGRWLRATQLDELPQLWNVLRGQMSLVGPRPIRPIFFEQLASDLPAYWQRLLLRPRPTRFSPGRRGHQGHPAGGSSGTTSSGSPIPPSGFTCGPSPRPAGACWASRCAGRSDPRK